MSRLFLREGVLAASLGAVLVLPVPAVAQDAAPPATRDSSGVTIVVNSADDRSLEWTIERELRIGDVLGPPETSFSELNPHSVATGPEGIIAVLNRGAPQVALFSSDGALIRTFGRGGEGPNEMRNPVSIWFTPGGRIRVLDWADAVLTYERDGEVVSDETPSMGMIGMGAHRRGRRRPGSLVQRRRAIRHPPGGAAPACGPRRHPGARRVEETPDEDRRL